MIVSRRAQDELTLRKAKWQSARANTALSRPNPRIPAAQKHRYPFLFAATATASSETRAAAVLDVAAGVGDFLLQRGHGVGLPALFQRRQPVAVGVGLHPFAVALQLAALDAALQQAPQRHRGRLRGVRRSAGLDVCTRLLGVGTTSSFSH